MSPDELQRAKTIIVTSELMEKQTNGDRAMQAALDELYGLGYDYREKFVRQVRAVTLGHVKEAATRYFTTPVIAVVTPLPDAVELGIEPSAIDGTTPAGQSTGDPAP